MAPRQFGSGIRGTRFKKTGPKTTKHAADSIRISEGKSLDERAEATKLAHTIDESMGFARYESGRKKVGWLCNMHSTVVPDDAVTGGKAAVDFYFLEDDGGSFKATVQYDPYFLIATRLGHEAEVEEWLRRKLEATLKNVVRLTKEDLQMPNHLLGYRRTFLKLTFWNVSDLLEGRKVLMPIAEKNKKNVDARDTYAEVASANAGFDMFDDDDLRLDERRKATTDASEYIVDIREYDVPYHVRVAIDLDIRIGKWYTVEAKHGVTSLACIEERLQRADPVVLAFDIETTKLPLKFPDAAFDQVMMISYMIDGQGFLITNREIVSQDIADFDYTPKPEYDGPFIIFNEPNEKAVLERFFLHIKEACPTVIATYNGDFFDWPFVETRAGILGIDMYREIGFRKNSEDIYVSDYCVHMDCFSWVKRDSYLPQGSQGLKAVTVAKLGYDPDELDPELMTRYAAERPQTLSEYSVSDAVATYYLYMKYVHPFIFSLCTIIPLNPDDVLRKGTGTLCEMLLMVQAYQKQIVLPNKHRAPDEAFFENQNLLESETYVGGHVECLEAGVFRSDIATHFSVDPDAVDELLRDLDAALKFSIVVEGNKSMDDVENYDEIRDQIKGMLEQLKATPVRKENPLIYHLDVASMYPNIMTTNRLQPDSMIQEADCAACDFNRPGKTCDRRMPWSYRAEFLPAKRDEYNMIKRALENERFPPKYPSGPSLTWDDLSPSDQAAKVKKRLQDYSKKIYHKVHETKTMTKEAIICQRENPFYVDTVKNFRDRRYDFKGKQKVWKGKTDQLKGAGAPQSEVDEAKKMVILFDSLQLAHKVILNSFYGYVMRKGSRWYSMEMAGVTCLTGAHIIQMARKLVERLGRPLELDTDGIWCILPASFPENFNFKMKGGKKYFISYPCVMLNHLVHAKSTNHQYQELIDPQTFKYETHSENTIFFEVDGPYKAMILPTSKEADKNLKKRYAVYNHDGTLAELKGFEIKRRGELKLIKIFQSQIFKFFLEGSTLQECYAAVAKVSDQWLDVLFQKGSTLADEELIDLICENKSMSKTLEEYGTQKTTAITTARRLAEFLGEQMVKDKGLNCKYIISSRPKNAPVTERAIPVAIFSAEPDVKRFFLKKWLRDDPGDMNPREVIDWGYYLERLGSVIQKLITIPAALQKLRNPVPRVAHPDWLQSRINIKDDRMKQKKMTDLFEKKALAELSGNQENRMVDMEDFASGLLKPKVVPLAKMAQKRKEPEAAVSKDPYASLPDVLPPIGEDYNGWLQYQKKKWKIQKQARIRRRQLFGETVTSTNNLGTFFRQQAEMLYIGSWEVLQLRESEIPGELIAFVLIDGKMQNLRVKVRRKLFLNLKGKELPDVEILGCDVDKVVSNLPNGHPSVHLFKLEMSEETYLNEADQLQLLFEHPSVEGVYEKSVPLTIRAVLELGNVCTFDETQQGVLGRGLEHGFDLKDLHKVPRTTPYLGDNTLGYIYLYHVVAGDRQIFALFSTTKAQAYVVVLNTTREMQTFPNMEKIYTEQLQRRDSEEQLVFEYPEKLHFKTTQVTTRRKAYLEVSDMIKKLRNDETRPLMLVLQSPQKRTLPTHIASINDFPLLNLRAEPNDSTMQGPGWQSLVAKRLVTRFLAMGSWISHHVELARYGDIPLCNLERDDPRFLIDVAYARRLQKNNVVLWWSPNLRPDHAGFEKDDVLGPLEHVDMPFANNAGSFSTVCVELEVRNLAINTILTSSIINELEGSDSVSFLPSAPSEEASDGSNVIFAENAFAFAGVAVLREMVKGWWNEARQGNTMADIMVQHMVHWVESRDSFLYDRTLHYYVQMMSKKAFQQLIMDFKRVGSNIIFASGNRLLIQTTKAEVGNAWAYSQYIVKNIKQKSLFHYLDLEIKEYWDYLLWYDAYNYGGKACSQISDEASQTLETVMHWQMAKFLPNQFQNEFHDWVIEFIELMHSQKSNRPALPLGPDGAGAVPRATQIPFVALTQDRDVNNGILAANFEKPLRKKITQLITRQKNERLHPEFANDYTFPVLPGSHLSPTNPVLELVKSLMAVFSLEKATAVETRLLKRDLLQLFEVRSEFSSQGQFVNPSSSLKIAAYTCPSCTYIRDLDLCRDEDLLPAMVTADVVDEFGARPQQQQQVDWKCPECSSNINRLAIEELLISRLHKSLIEWSSADSKCEKCKRVCLNEFAEHCPCSGNWVSATTIKGKEGGDTIIKKDVAVYGRVADAYGFRMLAGVVETMTKGLGVAVR